VPGAQVTLTNADTGIASVKTTSSSGQYIFDLVEPGSYRLGVDMTGFTSSLRSTSWSRFGPILPSIPH